MINCIFEATLRTFLIKGSADNKKRLSKTHTADVGGPSGLKLGRGSFPFSRYLDIFKSMSASLKVLFESHRSASAEGAEFLKELEESIAQDLWKSAGGAWSSSSENIFRDLAMKKLAAQVRGESRQDFLSAWSDVVRDFHRNYWNERRLLKKEVKPKTEEQKIFWELFSYIWMLLQAALVTKTAVFYFGIRSTEDDSMEGKIYVILAILVSFGSLFFFAYRKSKKQDAKNPDEPS